MTDASPDDDAEPTTDDTPAVSPAKPPPQVLEAVRRVIDEARDQPAGTVLPGDVLAGRYRVTAPLGRGGMGEVYAVHDEELDEPVALKLLRTELSQNPSYRQRLRSEVRLARRVSHPNVCRVHDIGQHEDHLFVTMELVGGRTLRALLREQQRHEAPPWPMATVIDIIVQLSSALSAAHRAGVLHRDIKPDNVMLEDGRAVLTDFGVASLASEGGANTVAGTPSYVAPEVLRGEPFDHRSDVYSASVVAYELLAGRAPFETRSMSSALRRAVARPAPPPLPSSVGHEGLRDALDAVLTAGLDPEPKRRLGSVDRLAEGLAAAVRGDPGGEAVASRVRRSTGDHATAVPSVAASTPEPTPATPVASSRRREVRVATVLRVTCDGLRREESAHVAPHDADDPRTQLVPLDLAGDDLERIAVQLGGVALEVGEHSMSFVFGAPISLGDDAVRAVRAARTILARTIDGRAGLDTVRVMVRQGADPVGPEVLRFADALAAAAPAGEMWLSAATARQVAAHVEVAPVKDVAGQRALRVSADMHTTADVQVRSQMRPRELARLEGLARACFEQRTPTLLEVRGAAGSGKTRLREALMARVSERREVDWLVARAATLGEAAPLSLLRSAHPSWFDAAMRAGAHDRPSTLAAARAWIEARATRRPVAIVFEDVQWADEMSRAVIADLAAQLDAVPVLMVTFSRDDGAAPATGAHVITLGPLDDDTAMRLAHEVAPSASDDALADVVARAGGNPYFVEELAREAAERGDGIHSTLPPTVEAAVQARLDRLSPAAADVVCAAAVVGRAFWREAVSVALTSKLDDAALDAALAELERRGLCHPAPPATVDDDRYEFAQALARDVAYQRLPVRDRRRAHAEVARWLELRAGRSSDPDVLLALAHHREQGGDVGGAAAAWRLAGTRCLELSASKQAHAALRRAWELSGGVDPALATLLGDAALESDGPVAAEEAYRAALSLSAEAPAPARARILSKLGEAASAAADHVGAIAWYEQALALLPAHEQERDPRLAATIYAHLGWVLAYQLSSTDPRGLAYCERAVELLEGTPHKRELTRALSRLGGAHMRAGRWSAQLACNRRTLELAQELGEPSAQITARINLGVVLANLGDLGAAITATEEAHAMCRRTGRRTVEGLCASNLAGYLLEQGELDDAERWLSDGIRLLERTGARRVLPESYSFLARIAARRGDLAAAERAAHTMLDLSRELAIDFDLAVGLRLLGQLQARRGDLPAAHASFDEASRRLETDPFEQARLEAARARVAARAGDPATAAAARARAADVFTRLGATVELRALDDLDDVR